jgi:hypothetical protein
LGKQKKKKKKKKKKNSTCKEKLRQARRRRERGKQAESRNVAQVGSCHHTNARHRLLALV